MSLAGAIGGKAFFFGEVGIVKFEICQADVNAGDSEGDSPLAHARALAAGHWQQKMGFVGKNMLCP